jgi:D-arabinose 1-dehydrogenase-like Zn-dependent alcohol dehydrogenase
MYSSIMKTKTRPGDYLAILGAGGGLGHMYSPNPGSSNGSLVF